MNRKRIVQKRTTLLQKLAYILRPFVIYMVVKTVAMLTLALFIPSLPITGIRVWVEENAYMLSAVVNAAASLIAVYFLLSDFLKEAVVSSEVDIDVGVLRQLLAYVRTGFESGKAKRKSLVLCAVLGVVSAFAFNILIELVSNFMTRMSQMQGTLGSQRYETVEQIQYSVPLLLGIILYGVISPLVEEIVFRGIIFNRIKRFYSVKRAVIFSALLFGAFHANLPQFVYGTCMGMLMALCYERTECFGAPVAFHMAANVSVFVVGSL